MKKFVLFLSFGLLLLNCPTIQAQFSMPNDYLEGSVDSTNLEKHTGLASWYSYRGGLFAASTKFKKGSVLRVVNPANGKHVDVTVNDYGPSKRKHPKRIIDLDKVAFKKIAHLRVGVINIIIYPLTIL